ncbi:MAG TPA: twin-arginine translocase TatA/TatE family subunit [Brumimicrobium sp.]|nr:twin-arginine translocase TatA/TatE family subunit [Brumimicrobium sp.]
MLLFINSIAGSEIVIILLFVLIFFGAKSIPGMARGLGKGIRQIKDASQDVQDEIRKTTTDMKRDVNINRALHEAKNTIESPIKEFTKDLKQSAVEVGKSIDGDTENTTKSIPSQETIETSDSKKEDDNIKLDQQKDS